MRNIQVYILDDDTEDGLYLAYLLKSFEGIVVLGIEDDPQVGIMNIINLNPEIVFLDIEMPGFTGFEVMDCIRGQNCTPAIIFTTSYAYYGIKALREGVFDYLTKPISYTSLENCMIRYKESRIDIGKNIKAFSPIELKIIKLLCEAKTSKEIGESLCLSPHTINRYRSEIMKKSKTKSTIELISLIQKGNFRKQHG